MYKLQGKKTGGGAFVYNDQFKSHVVIGSSRIILDPMTNPAVVIDMALKDEPPRLVGV